MGTIIVRLTNVADGDVVAGPVRLIPVNGGAPIRIQRIVNPTRSP